MISIRQSMLNDYEKCPYMCMKKWGPYGTDPVLTETTSKYAQCGTTLHKVAEIYNLSRMKGEDPTLDQVKEIYAVEFAKIPEQSFWGPEERELFSINYWEQVKWLYDNWLKNSIIPTAVELKFKTKVFGTKCTGTIDVEEKTDETVHLKDYKTNSVPYTYKTLPTNIQIWVYCYAYQKIHGILPAEFTFIFAKARAKRTLVITPEFMDKGLIRIGAMWENIKAGHYEPNKKDFRYCANYCDYFCGCPGYQLREVEYEKAEGDQNYQY